MKFDEISFRLFRSQLGKEIFEVPRPFKGKEVCVALSGGLDSSIIALIYKKQIPNLRSYTIGIGKNNEFDKAKKVAKHLGLDHLTIAVSRKRYMEVSKKLIKLKKEPLQVPNETLLYLLAKQFKKDIGNKKGIVLSGEGADELFGGYTNILENVPIQDYDLVENYMDRIVYNKELWQEILDIKWGKYLNIFGENDIEGTKFDRIQNWLLRLHFPALLQRLRSINLVKEIEFNTPFSNSDWIYLSQALPVEMRTNKTFLRVTFGRMLPDCCFGEKIGFTLPINLNKWQDWNLDIWNTGKSKVNFWK